MAEIFTEIRTIWINYSYYTINLVLYWMAAAWLFLFDRNWKKNRLLLLSVLIPAMLVCFQLANQLTGGGRAFDKLFFLLPTMPLLAYTGVRIAQSGLQRKNTWIIILLYAIIIQSGLGLQYDFSVFGGIGDSCKISAAVARLAGLIDGDETIEDPFVLAPSDIAVQIREYDSHIRVAYGDGYVYEYSSDFQDRENTEAFIQNLEQYGCNLFIIPWDTADSDAEQIADYEQFIQSLGYRLTGVSDGYAVYALCE